MGWDPREVKAYDVAEASIRRHASQGVRVAPLKLRKVKKLLTRPIERKNGKLWCPISQAPMATEFAISRFCIPLIKSKGWHLFCDCDVLFHSDIAELFALADPKFAVMVVKHKQETGPEVKMDGQAQLYYSRKNWSSVILWNLNHPSRKKFTSEMLNTWPGRDLHAFKWLDDSEIGELPVKWNWLIGVTPGEPKREGVWHYTLGVPNMPGYENSPHAEEWFKESRL
jgi:hypothetical protein